MIGVVVVGVVDVVVRVIFGVVILMFSMVAMATAMATTATIHISCHFLSFLAPDSVHKSHLIRV